MVTPSGRSGVQRVPKAGHSGGLRSPRSTKPLMHSPASSATDAHGAEAALGVEIAIGLGKAQPAFGDVADAAPAPRDHPEDLAHQRLRGAVAVAADGAAVLVLDLGAARLELAHAR